VHNHVACRSLHPMHCNYVGSHTCIFVIDHAEEGLTEPSEPAPVEVGNHEQDQDKPQCI
jgi:hypothetical protein